MGIEQHLPPHPALSPGERENLRTLRQHSGNVGFDPTHRSSAPRQPDKTCTIERPGALGPFRRAECSPSPLRRGERIPPKMAKNRNLARQSRLVQKECCRELHPLRFGSITKKYVHLQLFCWFDTATCEVAHSSRAARFALQRGARRGKIRDARLIQRPGSERLASTDGRMDGGWEGRDRSPRSEDVFNSFRAGCIGKRNQGADGESD